MNARAAFGARARCRPTTSRSAARSRTRCCLQATAALTRCPAWCASPPNRSSPARLLRGLHVRLELADRLRTAEQRGSGRSNANPLLFGRVSDGTRTRGRRDHNPELYQLSYAHQGRLSIAALRGGGRSRCCDRAPSRRWRRRTALRSPDAALSGGRRSCDRRRRPAADRPRRRRSAPRRRRR